MTTLESIKIDLPLVSLLSNEQVIFVKGGEDKREPRPSHAHSIDEGCGTGPKNKKGKRG